MTVQARRQDPDFIYKLRRRVWVWDPAGLAFADPPADEYDCIVEPMSGWLRADVPPELMATRLNREIAEHFGIPPPPDTMTFASELIVWYRTEEGSNGTTVGLGDPSHDVDPSRIATHLNPLRRDRADFLIRANLDRDGLEGWEQLWAKTLGDDRFEVCCVPFFAYGIALGDVVEAKKVDGQPLVVTRTLTRSGHRAARIVVIDPTDQQPVSALLAEVLVRLGFGHEWLREGYVAVDLGTNDQIEALRSEVNGAGLGNLVEFEIA